MAERRFSLCRFLRKKKKEGPETAPAQQPEEVEQPQPLQEDPGQDQTQEQDRARGRFRRAAQAVRKFVGIRRPKTRIAPGEVMAQPDPTPSELTAKADSATSEGEADTDIAAVQCPPSAPGLDIPGERVVSVEVSSLWEAMKPERDTEQRPPRVPKLAWLKEGEEEGPGAAPSQQPEEVEQSQPLQEDPGRDRTQEQDRARGGFCRAAQAFLKFLGIRHRKTKITPAEVMAQPDPMPSELKAHPEVGTALTDGTANCDSAVTDDGTKSNTALPELTMEADGETTEGIADTESTPIQCLPDALSVKVLDEGVVSAQVAMEPARDMEQRPPSVPKVAWMKEEEEESPGPAPAQHPEEVEQSQPLQEDPGRDRTQEQDRARGCFRRTAQWLLNSNPVRRRKARTSPTEVRAQPEPNLTKLKGKADSLTTEGITDTESTPVQCLPDALSVEVLDEGVVSAQVAMEPARDMEQRPPSVPKVAWMKEEEEESPGPAPAQHPEEVEQSQPPQEDPDWDRTQEQDRARGCFRRAAQRLLNSSPIQHRKARTSPTEVRAQPEPNLTKLKGKADSATTEGIADTDRTPVQRLPDAPSVEVLDEGVVSAQVPAVVRSIHWWLTANVSAGHVLDNTLLALTQAHPADVAISLLRCAPSCDRAAAVMWRTIASSGTTLEKVLPMLLSVMEDWPWHSTRTSDGDNTNVFALAATLALWTIVQEPQCPGPLMEYSPHLLVALLFQVFITTEQMSEEVDSFWRGCREEHDLPTDPNRFAVLSMKALLCCLHCEDVVRSVEHNRGWARLLNARSRRYAVALLAREMRRVSSPLCSRITLHLLELLSREELCWDLPAMAFLVEVLDCLDMRDWGGSVLQSLSRHLWSECPERRHLALRGLLVLSQDSGMAKRIWSLSDILVQLLGDEDRDTVWMTLSVLDNVLWSSVWTQLQKRVHSKDPLISTPTGLQLAEALRPLFDHDDSSVREGSMVIFTRVMKLIERAGKRPLKPHVCLSLLPLYFHQHDENPVVKKASREALLRAARFLKRRDLVKLLKAEQPWRFSECLLKKDRSRVVEYLHQALPYLWSPQEPVREAAVKFMGIAGRYLRGQYQELQLIIDALQATTDDSSPTVSKLALKNINFLRAVQRAPYLQQLRDQLSRAWSTRPSVWGCVCLCCYSCVES
ncbi:maestro heat-like repeat-containing protein family member 6 isoform X2 [Pseudopipra pipra]|uniref:maestro heat-like repeat-containing protein family member 6 isoform X2 n=1 Tax=Pseudopipra pipra TaxID=415032 RepID=UPI003139991C